jgi:hypothetical protein
MPAATPQLALRAKSLDRALSDEEAYETKPIATDTHALYATLGADQENLRPRYLLDGHLGSRPPDEGGRIQILRRALARVYGNHRDMLL